MPARSREAKPCQQDAGVPPARARPDVALSRRITVRWPAAPAAAPRRPTTLPPPASAAAAASPALSRRPTVEWTRRLAATATAPAGPTTAQTLVSAAATALPAPSRRPTVWWVRRPAATATAPAGPTTAQTLVSAAAAALPAPSRRVAVPCRVAQAGRVRRQKRGLERGSASAAARRKDTVSGKWRCAAESARRDAMTVIAANRRLAPEGSSRAAASETTTAAWKDDRSAVVPWSPTHVELQSSRALTAPFSARPFPTTGWRGPAGFPSAAAGDPIALARPASYNMPLSATSLGSA